MAGSGPCRHGGLAADGSRCLHEVHEFRIADLALQKARGNLAAVEDEESISDAVRVCDVVRDEDDVLAFIASAFDEFQDLLGLRQGQGRGRLVEDEQSRLEVEGAGNGHAFLFASG